MKQHFTYPNRFGIILELTCISAYYYNLFLWFPFYFTFIHYEEYASYLSIILPIAYVVGNILFQNLTKLCSTFIHWVCAIFYLMAIGIHWALL